MSPQTLIMGEEAYVYDHQSPLLDHKNKQQQQYLDRTGMQYIPLVLFCFVLD